MDLSDPRAFRRQMVGAAMIVTPILLVVAELLHARFEMEPADQLAAVAENPGRWYAAHVLVLAALASAVPAMLGLAHLLRPRRPALGHLVLIALVPGLVAVAAIAGIELVLWQMVAAEADRGEMVALAERLNESAGIVALFLVVLLFPLAWLLAGFGLCLARTVPVWTAVLIGLSQPVGFIGELAGGPKPLAVAAQVAFAAGLIPLGIRVLRQSDRQRDEPSLGANATPATA